MADTDNLSATLSSDPTGGSAASPDLGSGPPSGTGTSSNLGGAIQPSNPAPPPAANDLPRFNRFKSALAGFLMAGIPGAVTGAISPKAIQSEGAARQQLGQAKITFANAQAAHEVAMAHQADVEYQALPEKLQQESEARGLANMDAARKAGYLPVATVPLDQGQDQNSQGAMTALNSVKQQFGAVPNGLLYIHTGSGMTVMKLQDPAAALTTINQARRAQGMREIAQDTFLQLAPADRDSMARDAINFADPRDANGQVTQNSINLASMRLQTVKDQPQFNGKDALVTSLQQSVDHQKSVLDSGAAAEATRKGQAVGAEATAAQPGQTAAKVAEINATAGPEAAAAGAKAKAVAKGTTEGQLEATGGITGSGTVDPVTGADEGFISKLPPAQASTIRAIGEGRVELNSRTMASKDGKVLMAQLTQAYPGFDQSKAQSYFKVRQDFTSGKTATAINSYNTSIAHLGTMWDHVSSTSSLQINNPFSDVHRQLDLDKQLVSTELAKAVSNGQMTEKEKTDILSSISGATVGSYETRIKEAVQLLNGKLDSYQQQWKNGAAPGVVNKPPIQILSPQSQATIQKIAGGQTAQMINVQTSDGHNWHIPQEKFAAAQQRDPNLKVIQ